MTSPATPARRPFARYLVFQEPDGTLFLYGERTACERLLGRPPRVDVAIEFDGDESLEEARLRAEGMAELQRLITPDQLTDVMSVDEWAATRQI